MVESEEDRASICDSSSCREIPGCTGISSHSFSRLVCSEGFRSV